MRTIYLAAILVFLPVAVSAAPPTPPEPVSHPDWADAAENTVQALRKSFLDPSSATIEWVSGFKWGYRKPVIGKRTFGWIACGNYNAKNAYGGYVGNRGFDVVLTPDGSIGIYQFGDGISTCSRGAARVNPELQTALHLPSASQPSVADEIAKLADLKTKGLITEAEYAAQKAKLLSR